MNRSLSPAPGKLVLKKCKSEEKTGGLILPKEKNTQMYVICQTHADENEYMIDDMVILSTNYPHEIELDNVIYYVINRESVLALVSWK